MTANVNATILELINCVKSNIWKSNNGLASVTIYGPEITLAKMVFRIVLLLIPDSRASDPSNPMILPFCTVSPGDKMVLPKASEGDDVNQSVYLIEGLDGVKVDGKTVSDKVSLMLDASKDVPIELHDSARLPSEFLVLQGKPIEEPVAKHGPFVMNTQEETLDAFMDYQRTQFGGWPWPRDDMIFPRDEGRFALMDGRETCPPPTEKKEDEL